MDEQTLKTRRNLIRIAFIVLLAVLVGFLLYSGLVVKKSQKTTLHCLLIVYKGFEMTMCREVLNVKM